MYLFIDLFADQERRKINKGDKEEERSVEMLVTNDVYCICQDVDVYCICQDEMHHEKPLFMQIKGVDVLGLSCSKLVSLTSVIFVDKM